MNGSGQLITFFQQLLNGITVGSFYALVALGYTMVYGVLSMINFAHGDIFMVGAYIGFFTINRLTDAGLAASNPALAIFITFLAGSLGAAVVGITVERIAYRPLRKATRLASLISAIGASIFLQTAAQLLFGTQRRDFSNPAVIERGAGWSIPIGGTNVTLTYTGALTFSLSVVLMVGLYLLVQRTRLGRAMRAVAQDKTTAALMGIDVNRVISITFLISGALAGAAGVMWGLHNGLVYNYIGFIPGLKAFTAAVLGGIGNVPGAKVGGLFLGIVESVGPAALGMDFQLKVVIAFSILVLVLIFRPSGILGEVLTEEKV